MIRGPSRSISADCCADPNRSAGPHTQTPRLASATSTSPGSHRSRPSISCATAAAAIRMSSAGAPHISASTAWVQAKLRHATPPASGPASTSSDSSASAASTLEGVFVIASTRLAPLWRRSASSVSPDPPDAEIITASVSAAAGCGVPVDASSACASRPRPRSAATAVPAA